MATSESVHILTSDKALSFFLAGKAYFTLRSTSGARFTYRILQLESKPLYFVSVLTGSDNMSDYTYLGSIKIVDGFPVFTLTKGSKIYADAKSYKAFLYTFTLLANNQPLNFVEVWHEGKCARCGHKLTDPISIEIGFGPYCRTVTQKNNKKYFPKDLANSKV